MVSKSALSGSNGHKVSPFALKNFETNRRLAARTVDTASRYTYKHGSYQDAPDIEATWFIDPPYQGIDKAYKESQHAIDFDELGEWVRSRRGLVIVCESPRATWLPFRPFSIQTSINGPKMEVWWCNQPDLFDSLSIEPEVLL